MHVSQMRVGVWLMGGLLLLPPVIGAVPGPVGSEFQVNTTTTGYQYLPRVAADGAGNFVVVWGRYGQGIIGQRYDGSGVPIGSEIQVSTPPQSGQRNPAVATDGAGNFVVVWGDYVFGGPDGSGFGVFGRRYDSTGSPQGAE